MSGPGPYASPELAFVERLLREYARLYLERYHAQWMPDDECIQLSIGLFKTRMPGFPAYTVEDLLARLQVFFRSREDWLTSCKHNFKVFVKHIHRWVSSTSGASEAHRVNAQRQQETCIDHPEQVLKPGQVCAICFPMCAKCRRQHSRRETCAECESREGRLKDMLTKGSPRGRQIVSVAGDVVLSEKQVKDLRDADQL